MNCVLKQLQTAQILNTTMTKLLNNTKIKFKIDTGARVNISMHALNIRLDLT